MYQDYSNLKNDLEAQLKSLQYTGDLFDMKKLNDGDEAENILIMRNTLFIGNNRMQIKKLDGTIEKYNIEKYYPIDEKDEMAYEIVSEMKPKGEVWSKDVINGVVGGVPNLNDYYVVMNSLVNDYGEVIPQEEVDTYVRMTNAWLNDIDGHHNKVWWYFVKKD